MTWRRLRPGELDHEVLWLAVSIAAACGAWVWLRLSLPVPECAFHRWTGLACPTCGMTRCLRFVFHSNWTAAVSINPLALASYGLVAAFDLYAAAVVALRLPRLRFDTVSPAVRRRVRYAAIAAILANWAWLLWTRL